MTTISIGSNCFPKFAIDTFIGNQTTYFFDWLVTGHLITQCNGMNEFHKIYSMKNVNNILLRNTPFNKNEFKISDEYFDDYDFKSDAYFHGYDFYYDNHSDDYMHYYDFDSDDYFHD